MLVLQTIARYSDSGLRAACVSSSNSTCLHLYMFSLDLYTGELLCPQILPLEVDTTSAVKLLSTKGGIHRS